MFYNKEITTEFEFYKRFDKKNNEENREKRKWNEIDDDMQTDLPREKVIIRGCKAGE